MKVVAQKLYNHRKLILVLLVALFATPIHFANANPLLEGYSFSVFKIFSLITGIIAEVIRNILVLAAPLLDTLVQSSFNSEDLFADAPFVVIGWTLVRDFANILFILIFVVVAIGTILGIQAYSARKLLPKLIGVALIVNFSRVIAGFLIDIAQSVMLYFLQFGILASDRDISIVLALMNGMRLDMLTSLTFDGGNLAATAGSFTSELFNWSPAELQLQDVIINIMTIVFMGAATIVFLWLAWTLIVRIVALWVLIIIAPIAWVVGILPFGAGMMKSWWENFFKWNFVGISVGFFLFLSMLLLQSFNTLNFGTKFTDVRFNSDGISSTQADFADRGGLDAFLVGQTGFLTSASPILMYATVISFLFFSVNAAKKGSAFGAGVIVDKGTALMQRGGKGLGRGALKISGANFVRNRANKLRYKAQDKATGAVGGAIKYIPGLRKTGRRVQAGAEFRSEQREKTSPGIKLSHYSPELLWEEYDAASTDRTRAKVLKELVNKGGHRTAGAAYNAPGTGRSAYHDFMFLRDTVGDTETARKLWGQYSNFDAAGIPKP